jgi:F0F1-type ATP synthase delta subunit
MKILPEYYAQAYYDLISQTKNGIGKNKITTNFINLLNKNNAFKDSNKIVNSLESLINRKEGVVKAQLFSAYDIQDNIKLVKKVENLIKTKYSCQNVVFDFKINKDLISGIVIKTNNETINLSLKNQIINLKHKLKEI